MPSALASRECQNHEGPFLVSWVSQFQSTFFKVSLGFPNEQQHLELYNSDEQSGFWNMKLALAP
jgi:hypothetical protein